MSTAPISLETASIEKEKTFRHWVTEHSDILFRFALQRMQDEDLCKDMVQDTFYAAWRNMDGFKGEASVKNWLFVILKSKITDHYRKTHTRLVVNSIQQQGEDIFFDEEDHWRSGMYPKQWSVDFSNKLEAKEFLQVFQTCGKKMKALQNNVFVMKYVAGMDSEEICKELGITSANYWVLIHRAKLQLRACLEKNWIQK